MMKLMALLFVIFVSVACGGRADRRESTQAPRPTPPPLGAQTRCEERGGTWVETAGIALCEQPESVTSKNKEPVYQQPSPSGTKPTESAPTESAPTESAPSQSEPSAGCLESWEQFGAIDDLQDSLADAVPTLFACSNVKEWIQAGEATPGHSLIVIRLTAENLCRGQEGTQGAPVCESLKG